MDIEILLWLQDFREATDNILTPAMKWLSHDLMIWPVMVPFVIYWCFSKKAGLFLIISVSASRFFNAIMKVAACVYRPWIQDPRIIPAGSRPSSYSFPSGHTMWSAPIFGGLAVLGRRSKFAVSLCGLVIVLVAFARMYLGVHTPQDVICGTLAGLAAVWLASVIINHPEHENKYLIAGVLLCIAGIAYTVMKSYPMDYADGKLIVDPFKMTFDTFYGVGIMSGLILGRLIERKFIRFQVTGFNVKGVILAVIGLIPVYFIQATFAGDYKLLYEVLEGMFTVRGGRFVMGFMLTFWTVAAWPCV
ncbi:MAG: phosphatase PAP2 family protein, partial [Synergistaceae bacterium]|nr:phosphatase PAP2 family protein [Synergistaceae bacterium]MBQ6664341.1 phosphatase PAP2 family protein [Synergistaceae bacterium]